MKRIFTPLIMLAMLSGCIESDENGASPSPSPSLEPSVPPSVEPSVSPTPSPTPSTSPSASPSALPSVSPSPEPSVSPLPSPSVSPSPTPTTAPAGAPIEGGVGKPSSVPADAKLVKPGTDLSTLSGVNKLQKGEYVMNGGFKDNVVIYSADGIHQAVVKLPDGKVTSGGTGVKLYGLRFVGGGFGKYNHEAALITNDKWYLEDVLVEKAKGTGINIQGTGIKSVRLIAQDNGASGRGMKVKGSKPGDGYYELDAIVRRNNYIVKDGDGASKATKSTGILIENLHSYENMGRGLWFDTRNSEVYIKGGAIHDQRTKKPNEDWSYGGGLDYEYNAGPTAGPGGMIVDGTWFWGNDGISIGINESENVEIKNCVFKLGKKATAGEDFSKEAIQFRNIERNSGKERNLVSNIWIHHNRFEDGTGIYNHPAGVKLGSNKIKIENNDWVKGENVKVPK